MGQRGSSSVSGRSSGRSTSRAGSVRRFSSGRSSRIRSQLSSRVLPLEKTTNGHSLPSPPKTEEPPPDFVITYMTTTEDCPTPKRAPPRLAERNHSFGSYGVFRNKKYDFVFAQLQQNTTTALEVIKTYVRSAKLDLPYLFVGADFVDCVIKRSWPVPLNILGATAWSAMTTMSTHAVRKTKVLDGVGDNIRYVQVCIESGIRKGVPLLFNVLFKRTVTEDKVSIVFQSIADDDKFSLPAQTMQACVSGWIMFESEADKTKCRQVALVRFRSPKMEGIGVGKWVASVARKWLRAEESTLKTQLHLAAENGNEERVLGDISISYPQLTT
ncbi:hypothetical protein AC1031_000156 [Aphanomyces cochlioides]|nr:hypothetical protein AC1031_000156 [Aphanomyces cochlioides]